MSKLKAEMPDFGNWISKILLYISGAFGVLFLGLSFIFLISVVVSIISFSLFAYFAYAYYMFSPKGGNVQSKIRELVLNRLNWNGEGQVLDIGCGNAPLTIAVAKKFPKAHVTGVDYWGGIWGYSKSACERNAKIEGVEDRIAFHQASASALPFENGVFDVAVSNLVFHEVSDIKDKRTVIREALRVVKKGGNFAFQDLFLDKRVYGKIEDLLKTIKSWGIENVEFADTSHSSFIPKALKPRIVVGTIGILYGKK